MYMYIYVCVYIYTHTQICIYICLLKGYLGAMLGKVKFLMLQRDPQ